MDVSLLNPFAHAVPKAVDASISDANAACIAFNHSSTAPALRTKSASLSTPDGASTPRAGPNDSASGVATAAPTTAPSSSNTPADHRPHSLFAGNYLAAGRLDGMVAIWDIETRCCLRWFDAHARQVTSVAWSPHGRYLASSSLDWTVIVWDLGLKTGEVVPARRRTIRFDAPVVEVRFSPVSSLLLLAVLETQQAYIIDLRRPKYTLEQVPVPIDDGAQDRPSSSDLTANLAATGNAINEHKPPYPLPPDPTPSLTLEPSTYNTAVFTPDGKLIFAGTSKGQIHIVDPQNGKTLTKLNATSPSGIRALAFDRTGSKMVVNVHDRTIRTFLVEYDYSAFPTKPGWPFPSPSTQKAKEEHAMDVDASKATPNGDESTPADDPPTPTDSPSTATTPIVVLHPVHKLTDLVNRTPWNGIGWSGDGGEYVYAGAAHKAQHNIYLWDTASGTLEKVLQGPKDPLVDVDWHPTRPVIASVCSTGAVHLWFSKSEEAWSAYAPQFEELEENIQYEEREDEFDLEDEDELSRRKQDEEEALVDISGAAASVYSTSRYVPLIQPAARGAKRGREEDVVEDGSTERQEKESVKRASVEGGGDEPSVRTDTRNGPDDEANVEGSGADDVMTANGQQTQGSLEQEDKSSKEAISQSDTSTAPSLPKQTQHDQDVAMQAEADPLPEKDKEGETGAPAEGVSDGTNHPDGEDKTAEHATTATATATATTTTRASFVWRWVRATAPRSGQDATSIANANANANGTATSATTLYESDDDVDPCFVIPVQLEDGNSSSEGSSRSD